MNSQIKPADQKRNNAVQTNLTAAMLADLDRLRGHQPRADYMRDLLEQAIYDAATQAPAQGGAQ